MENRLLRMITKIIGFLTIVILVGYYFMNILCCKYADGTMQMENYYKEKPETIDVICLGSSHTFCNINPKTLWEEFGIASYDLASSLQPFWNSFFYLKEALLYQKPKLVILDVFRAMETNEYIDHSRIIKNTFGISSFCNRFSAIWHSSPEYQRIHYCLAYPAYHRRYSDISKADFIPQSNSHKNEKTLVFSKGLFLFTNTSEQLEPKIEIPSSGRSLSAKTTEYLFKIIELCKDNHIPLLLCVTPYAGINVNHEAYYTTVQAIAREEGIPFINFNHCYRNIGLDFSKDMADSNHLNHRGSAKFSRFLGEYIKTQYNLSDHRGEIEYDSYETMCKLLQLKIDNQEVSDTKNITEFVNAVKGQQERYLLIIGVQGDYQLALSDSTECEKLGEIGIFPGESCENDVWVIDEGTCVFHAGKTKPFDWHMIMQSGFVRVSCDEKSGRINCNLNREIETFISHGLSIVVYDKIMEQIVDRAGFPVQDGCFKMKQSLKKNAA